MWHGARAKINRVWGGNLTKIRGYIILQVSIFINFKYAYTLVDFWHNTSLISLTSAIIFLLKKIAALNINIIESVINIL